MSVEKRAGQFIGGILSNPTVVFSLILIVAGIILYFRIKNKDKRDAKDLTDKMEDEAEQINQNKKALYKQVAEIYGWQEKDIQAFDEIAYRIALSIKSSWWQNDNEDIIIKELNRLNGPKGIATADFFYKRYQKNVPDPNIAYDSLHTLSRIEKTKLKKDLEGHLIAYAQKTKGTPRTDVYFFDGKQLLHPHKTIG